MPCHEHVGLVAMAQSKKDESAPEIGTLIRERIHHHFGLRGLAVRTEAAPDRDQHRSKAMQFYVCAS
jgi:hypothetical protein